MEGEGEGEGEGEVGGGERRGCDSYWTAGHTARDYL